MQDKKSIKKPKDGCFSTLQELKLYLLQKAKDQSGTIVTNIPIVYEHLVYNKGKQGVQLFYARPEFKMGNLLNILSKKAIERQKAQRHEGVYIFLKKNKKLLHISDEDTVLQKYEKFKDQNNYLHICYQLHSQSVGCPLSGYEVAALFLIIPFALPVIGTVMAFDWSTKQIKNIKVPSLPSIKMPVFRSKQHHFKFKQKFTLQQRRQKSQQLKLNDPSQIYVIVQRHERSILPQLPFNKYMIESQLVFRHFCMMMQERISKYFEKQASESKNSYFFVIGGKIPHHDDKMGKIYQKFKDQDGMLYVTYQEQESF